MTSQTAAGLLDGLAFENDANDAMRFMSCCLLLIDPLYCARYRGSGGQLAHARCENCVLLPYRVDSGAVH